MNLDIVLEWMKTYTGKITPCLIQRNFKISWWAAKRIYDMLVKEGHVIDENRKAQLLLESQKEAAPEMYELLDRIKNEMECTPEWYRFINDVEGVLKKARGEK